MVEHEQQGGIADANDIGMFEDLLAYRYLVDKGTDTALAIVYDPLQIVPKDFTVVPRDLRLQELEPVVRVTADGQLVPVQDHRPAIERTTDHDQSGLHLGMITCAGTLPGIHGHESIRTSRRWQCGRSNINQGCTMCDHRMVYA
jgi:hypothetical protein